MTGPVERVPLTDEHLLQLETLWLGPTGTGRTSEELTAARLEQFGRIALEDVPGLLAELRASRAREQELYAEYDEATQELAIELAEERIRAQGLQQRFDKTLVVLHQYNPRPDLNGDQFAQLRAILTGAEPDGVPLD